VHVAGLPVRACQRRMETLAGATVTTIEGLDPAGEHVLQVAWRDIDVPQCGFCQSGQIMPILAFQLGAALAALAPVYVLHW